MEKKCIKSLLALNIIASTFTGVLATMVNKNHSVSTMQEYKYLPTKDKSKRTDVITLSNEDPKAGTFFAKADGRSYTTVTQAGLICDVKYAGIYKMGTPMTARFRNNSRSLNSNMIIGVFDYR